VDFFVGDRRSGISHENTSRRRGLYTFYGSSFLVYSRDKNNRFANAKQTG
jgi:hypothetical protein